MKIRVDNLGVIRSAEVSTSGLLTVFNGPNSTGKTYLSYLLYHLLSDDSYVELDIYDRLLQGRKADNFLEFEYDKQIIDYFLNEEADRVRDELGVLFGISNDKAERLFADLALSFSISEEEFSYNKHWNYGINAQYNSFVFVITLNDVPGKIRIEKAGPKPIPDSEKDKVWKFLICQSIRRIALLPITKSWMLTVERNSIYTFNNELMNYRLMDDGILAGDDLIRLGEFGPRRYPLAIRRSLRYASDIENIKQGKSEFYEYAVELEERLLHGNIETSQNGEIEFVVGSEANPKILPIHLTSSIVKTMASLILFLKYSARKNDVILIDEPEMNLHPDNQVVLARIFGELINQGLRLIISTHSDYIVREFNSMMMGMELKRHDNYSYREYGLTDSMLLDRRYVNVYAFVINDGRSVDVMPVGLDRYGFSANTIDETIRYQNDMTDTLHDILKFEYPES